MTEDEIAGQLEGIEYRASHFHAWLAETGGVRCGYDSVCLCCGYPYLYLDMDFHDPCPICLAPASALAANGDAAEVTEAAPGHPAILLGAARRNFVLHEQIYPPDHPRHLAEYSWEGARFAVDFEIALVDLDPSEMEERLADIAEDHFEMAKRDAAARRRAGYWRLGEGPSARRVFRAAGEPPRRRKPSAWDSTPLTPAEIVEGQQKKRELSERARVAVAKYSAELGIQVAQTPMSTPPKAKP